MRNTVAVIGAALLLAGCSQQPAVDVSGEWYFLYGGRLVLKQQGRMLTATGYFPTATSGPMPIKVQGRVQGQSVLLTFDSVTNPPMPIRYEVATSPKGNQRFLKCPQYLTLTLIPEGVDYFKHEILKPELTELSKKRKGSQQSPAGDRLKAPPEE